MMIEEQAEHNSMPCPVKRTGELLCWSSGFSLRGLTLISLSCGIPPRTNSAGRLNRRRLKPEFQFFARNESSLDCHVAFYHRG